MSARVRLLREVREVEGRQHSILLNPDKRVAELHVAAILQPAHLKLRPETFVFMVRQDSNSASRRVRDDVVRLRVDDEIEKERDGKARVVCEVQAAYQVHKIEAR